MRAKITSMMASTSHVQEAVMEYTVAVVKCKDSF
jgi:hypothetical protein